MLKQLLLLLLLLPYLILHLQKTKEKSTKNIHHADNDSNDDTKERDKILERARTGETETFRIVPYAESQRITTHYLPDTTEYDCGQQHLKKKGQKRKNS